MGIPGFFSWISKKYPSIVVRCMEEKPRIVDGQSVPVDTTKLNPNNIEFHTLYLDMNSIIHTCSHPEKRPAPKSDTERLDAMFEYLDRIFAIVRPRKLVYFAVDGVAPRAKMNQQRSRRFKRVKESERTSAEMARLRVELEERGARLPPVRALFDSNCITPGTEFMDMVNRSLHFYVHHRLNYDPGWKSIEVVLSDSTVPGEGEHKIMDFIRAQKGSKKYDSKLRHCLYGPDSDLIMLGLLTHEPNFTIIKEDPRFNHTKFCRLCEQTGHEMPQCRGLPDNDEDIVSAPDVPFVFVRIDILRDLLTRDLQVKNLPFPFDKERVIDDWVLLCFLVGNDFLPHLPSLSISERAVERLMGVYRETLRQNKGYLTKKGYVALKRLEVILKELAKSEEHIFKQRHRNEVMSKARTKERAEMKAEVDKEEGQAFSTDEVLADVKYDELLPPRGVKRALDIDSSDNEEDSDDEVRLWEGGWKDRYYVSKFDVSPENVAFRQKLVREYVKGLCWVLRYYVQGCASWTWFFPHLYGPFASDFVDIDDVTMDFDYEAETFKPMEQLMSVLPASSSKYLPEPLAELMLDPNSPITDFYPVDFKIDLNGHKHEWQGVALLPFIEENRLLDAISVVYPLLDDEQANRNTDGDDMLYVREGQPAYDYFVTLYDACDDYNKEFDLGPEYFMGVEGKCLLSRNVVRQGSTMKSIVDGVSNVQDSVVLCVRHRCRK